MQKQLAVALVAALLTGCATMPRQTALQPLEKPRPVENTKFEVSFTFFTFAATMALAPYSSLGALWVFGQLSSFNFWTRYQRIEGEE